MIEATGATGASTVATEADTVAKTANTAATFKLKNALKGLWATMRANPIYLIIATMAAAAIAVKAIISLSERHSKKLQELKTDYSNLKSEIESLDSELSTNLDRLKKLEDLEAPTLADKTEMENLRQTNAMLETQLALKEELAAEKSKKIADTFVKAVNTELTSTYNYEIVDDTPGSENPLSYGVRSEADELNAAFESMAETRAKLADRTADLSQKEREQLENLLKADKSFIKGRIEVYDTLTADVSRGMSAEADERLDLINDLRIRFLALSDDADHVRIAFSNIFSDARFDDGAAELTTLANAGQLSASAIRELSKTNPEVKALIDYLEKLGLFSWDNIDGLANQLKDVEQVSSGAGNGILKLTNDLSKLTDQYDLLSSVQKEFKENGALTADTLSKIEEQYPSLQESIDFYILGLKSGKELLAELSAAYQTDVNNYRKSIAEKLMISPEFYNSLSNKQKTLVDDLAKSYGVDLENFKTLESKKLEFQTQIIRQLSAQYAQYTGASMDTLYNAQQRLILQIGRTSNAQDKAKLQAELSDVTGTIQAALKMQNNLNAIANEGALSWDPKKYASSTYDKSSSATKEKGKTMAEIYAALTELETETERQDDRLSLRAENTTEEQIQLWANLRKNAVAELNKITDHTSEAYRYVEDVVKNANSHLDDLYGTQLDAIDEIIEQTKKMIKQDADDHVDALEKQIDKYREIVDLQKKLLENASDEADYEKEVAKRVKEISDLQSSISQLDLEIKQDP